MQTPDATPNPPNVAIAQIAQTFRERVNPQVEELFDCYLIVGYSSKDHHRIVMVNPGTDQACADGMCHLVAAANMWQVMGRIG